MSGFHSIIGKKDCRGNWPESHKNKQCSPSKGHVPHNHSFFD